MLIPRGTQMPAIHGLPELGGYGLEASLWLAVSAALGALLWYPGLGALIGPLIGVGVVYAVMEWARSR